MHVFAAMPLTAAVAFAVSMPVAAQEKPPGGGLAPECAASVVITGLNQVNLSIRVNFSWTTIGATAPNARVEMFHHPSGIQVYNSGLFSVSPLSNGSMQRMIPPPGGTPFSAGTYGSGSDCSPIAAPAASTSASAPTPARRCWSRSSVAAPPAPPITH